MKLKRNPVGLVLAVLAVIAIVLVAIFVPSGGTESVQPQRPQLGVVPQNPDKRADQIEAAQEAAVDKCKLTPAEVKERTGDGSTPLDHDSGDCAPGSQELKASITSGTPYGCDRSNNNPIYGVGSWQGIRRAGISYCWFKTSEGASYRDPTVERMARDARDAGVAVGGYHFAHVCGPSPHAEAALFIAKLRSARLEHGPLRPALDVEYGGCSTQAGSRAWIKTLYDDVQKATGARLAVYSGPWWLNPRAGGLALFSLLPPDTLRWISGYPNIVGFGGRVHVHQFTSSGAHGISGDVNRLVAPTVFSDLFAGATRQAPPEARHQCRMHKKYAAQYRFFKARQKKRWAEKPPRPLGTYGRTRLGSAVEHLAYERRYFTKNHERGKVNYDCLDSGEVKVRVL